MAGQPERRHDTHPTDPSARKVQRGLLGDVAPVGEGIIEMREFFGPGWRMYFVERDGMLIVMIGGGDKSTQSEDIVRAIALSRTIME